MCKGHKQSIYISGHPMIWSTFLNSFKDILALYDTGKLFQIFAP